MKAIFYSINDDKNKLDKNLVNGYETTILLKSGLDSLIDIEISIFPDVILNYNYVYIEKLQRYYFIDDITLQRNNYFICRCTEDVLMSFKDEIKKQEIEVNESENVINNNKTDYQSDNIFTKIQYDLKSPLSDEKTIIMVGI